MSVDFKSKKGDFSSLPGLPDKFVVKPNRYHQQTLFSSTIASKWTSELCEWITSFLMKCSYPYRKTKEIPFEEPLFTSIRRFLISLDAYIESPNPVVPISYILINAGKLDFATTLKRIRLKSFLKLSGGHLMESVDWWNDTPSWPIKDIGDIFNYQYLPHFEEECEDYLEGFKPLNQTTEMLNLFKETCEDLFQDLSISRRIEPDEILLSTSGSSVLTENFTTKKNYLVKGTKSNAFSQRRQVCKRVVIQVHPAGARDAVINQLADLNTIKLIEFQTQLLLEENFKKYMVNKDNEDFLKKYSKFQKKFDYYICRDITKEGITKPRNLLKIMLTVLNKLYPEIPAFQYTSFYDSYSFIKDDKIISPIRGHGLGMANALTSLMQVVVFNLTMRLASTVYISEKSSFLTLNDDIILGFPDRSSLEEYWDAEETVFEGLGLLRAAKKSFYAKRAGVFVEKYFCWGFPDMSRKLSYNIREMLIALTATNIVQAKQIVSSQSYIDTSVLQKYFEEIITFWGYEFFENEYEYPASCGGWLSHSIYGVSLDLKVLEKLPYNDKVERAFRACLFNRIEPRGGKDKFVVPAVMKVFPFHFGRIEEEHYKKFSIGTERDLTKEYSRLRYNPSSYANAWNYLLKKRHKTYLNDKSQWTFKEFISKMVTSSKKDFYPLDFMVEKTVKSEVYKGKAKDFYQSPNPLLGYLSSIIPIEGIHPNKYSIHFLGDDTVDFKLTADHRKKINRYVGILPMTNKMSRKDFNIPEDPEEFLELMESFINPLRLSKVYGDLDCCLLPILKPEYRPEIIKLKKEVFGRFLSKDELIMFSKLRKLSITKIKILLEFNLTIKSFQQIITRPQPIPVESEVVIKPLPEIKNTQISEEDYEAWDEGDEVHRPRLVRLTYEAIQSISNEVEAQLSDIYFPHGFTPEERLDIIDKTCERHPEGRVFYKLWYRDRKPRSHDSESDNATFDEGGLWDF